MNRIKTEVKESECITKKYTFTYDDTFYCFGHHHESFGKQKY